MKVHAAARVVSYRDRYAWGLVTATPEGIAAQPLTHVLPAGANRVDALVDLCAALLTRPGLADSRIDLACTSELVDPLRHVQGSRQRIRTTADATLPRYQRLWPQALAAARGALNPQRAARERTVVAVDGSFNDDRGQGGWGWVTGRANFGFGTIRCRGASAAEMAALREALEATDVDTPVTVLTDCRMVLLCAERAISAAEEGVVLPLRRMAPETRTATLDLMPLVRDRDILVELVRGHSGHPLNEVADRLAHIGRRLAEGMISVPESRRRSQDVVAAMR